MMSNGASVAVKRKGKFEEGLSFSTNYNLFSRKFKKKSDFILNSGNLYLTLQSKLCPYVS